jgi:hypothetical protein
MPPGLRTDSPLSFTGERTPPAVWPGARPTSGCPTRKHHAPGHHSALR